MGPAVGGINTEVEISISAGEAQSAAELYQVESETPDGISVLAVQEAAAACTRLSNDPREFRAGVTFSTDETWLSWRGLVTVFDTAAMISMISESAVDSSWKYVDGSGGSWSSVTSVDGVKISVGGMVIIPGWSVVFNGQVNAMVATVVKSIPSRVELLIGLPVILSPNYSMVLDLASWRVHVRMTREVIRLDLIHRILMRRALGPVNILCLCAGMCSEVAVLMELGFNVVLAYAVEISSVTREMASAAFPIVRFSPNGDISCNVLCDMDCDFFAVFCGPQCVHWSSLRNNPGGYKEEGSATFTSCAARMRSEYQRCAPFRLLETVRVHDQLVGDMPRQERECGGGLQELNSNAVGGVAGRPRRYFAPDVDFNCISRFRHTNPDYAADDGWQFRVRPVPAPVARGHLTKSPIEMIQSFGNYCPRFANSDERDRINPGLAAGISNGYGRATRMISAELRDRANGNAFSADALWSIVRMWKIKAPIPAVLVQSMTDMRSWPGSEQLKKFALMSDVQMSKYFEFLSVGLTMPKLDIASLVDPVHTTNFQTTAPGFTKSGLGPSCDYCIDVAIRDGTHKEVEWSNDLWICLLFFQKKKDRTVVAEFDGETYKKGDVLWAMRPLRDYTKLNSAMALRIPGFWREFCPTVEAIRSVFPSWCEYLAVHDCKNAFHSVGLTDDSARFCNSKYINTNGRKRIIQGIGCDQGISAIALFFPIWIRYGYFWFFGQAWLEDAWFADFVDDTLCFGRTESDCRLKMKLLNTCKHHMGLTVSAKQDISVYKEVEFVGLVWTAAGITVGKDSVKFILQCLAKIPIGVKQARMVRGVLVQAKSVFSFSPSEMLRFNELLASITECIVEGESSGKYSTSDTMKSALEEFATRLADQPRRYTNPNDILGDDRCLALLGDADPSAVVSSLWIIMRADANNVCPADFESESSVLLGIHPKTLSGSSLLWHISEKELMVMVYGVRKFGKLITEAIARWTLSADQTEWSFNKRGQLLVPVPKICFASDSKAALGMLNVLRLPSGRLEHLTPKLERVTGWAEDCAETLYWPLARLFVPGEGSQACNSLCDFIVRFVGELRRMKNEHMGDVLSEEMVPSPMTSAVLVAGSGDFCEGVPSDMQLTLMPLSAASWSEIHRSYALDSTMYSGVAISDIYKVANGVDVPAAVHAKIAPWMGKVFFAVNFRGQMKKFLCHRRSFLLPYDAVDSDKTKLLVPVVPANAMVRVSGRPPYVPGHDGVAASDLPLWQAEDLRADIVWWAHYCRHPHSRKAQTVERTMMVGWWPRCDVQAKMEYRLCSVCNDIRLVLSGIGLGMMAQGRFSVVQMDDAKLSPELKLSTGFVSVLVLTCVCTGAVCYIPRKEMDCSSTAFHIFTSWVKENGWFRILKSDSDPAYASALIAVLLKLVGIKDGIVHMRNALGSHSRQVERSISLIRKVIREAEKYADIRCARDFEIFIASAQIEANQLAVADGSTVFERTRGVKAITDAELLAVRRMPDKQYAAAVKGFKSHERRMIDLLRDRIDNLAAERRVQQEKRAEYNYAHALGNESTRKVHDMSSCEGVGLLDTVSYQGDCYTLEAAEPVDQWPPARVFLRSMISPDTNCKWVSWKCIRPLSIEREPLLLPRIQSDTVLTLSPGDVLVYTVCSDPSAVTLGRVLVVTDAWVKVHVLEPAASKVVTFVALWHRVSDPSDVVRRVKCPDGRLPVTAEVDQVNFVTAVVLQKNHALDDPSRKYLESLGLHVDLKSHLD